MPKSSSTPLLVTQTVLRVLVALNGIYGAVILAILVGLLVAAPWTQMALGFGPAADAAPLLGAMRWIAALGLVGVPLNLVVLSRLLAMVGTVRASDPFVAENAARLQTIAWAVLGQQLLQLAIGLIARTVSTPAHPLHISAFSTGGWLAVLLLFVLARVFAEGARMRDDLEGTV